MVPGPGGGALKLASPDDFVAYLEAKSPRVDRALEHYLDTIDRSIPNLHDGIRYALGLDVADRAMRGKRLRPVLCLLVGESLGGKEARAMPFAMASEMVHNFFLVHDDIQDGDTRRRGRDSVWVKYGRDHGINIGDYMFALTFDLVLRSREAAVEEGTVARLLQLMTDTIRHTGEGQAMDMNDRRRRDLTLEDYLRTVEEKTGYYLAAALIGGAMVEGAGPVVVSALERFGRLAMPVFQIADDLLDLTPAKGRGEIGCDIKEGKRSFLVIHTAHHCSAPEAAVLFDILDRPREETTKADVEKVVRLYEKYDATEAGRKLSKELLTKARHALDEVSQPLRGNLVLAADFLNERRS